MKRLEEKRARWLRRKKRVRKKILGTESRPRLTVYKSNRRIYVQVIDDSEGRTLASISNLEKEFKEMKKNRETANRLGEVLGARMKELKIERAVFDRNGYPYHGIVKAVAEGLREAGIVI
ncbi:MAG: 50S ribosomal protein L18 [Spirochaetes bacterium]|nr:MAG: 50S ribosomal protein L18 [Spirochaetota bacterium]